MKKGSGAKLDSSVDMYAVNSEGRLSVAVELNNLAVEYYSNCRGPGPDLASLEDVGGFAFASAAASAGGAAKAEDDTYYGNDDDDIPRSGKRREKSDGGGGGGVSGAGAGAGASTRTVTSEGKKPRPSTNPVVAALAILRPIFEEKAAQARKERSEDMAKFMVALGIPAVPAPPDDAGEAPECADCDKKTEWNDRKKKFNKRCLECQ